MRAANLARIALVAPLFLAACADTAITTTDPQTPPESEPARASVAPEPVPAATTAGADVCDARNAYVASGVVPSSWKKTGKVVFTIAGNAVRAEEAVDATGETVATDRETAPLARDTLEKFPAKWICKVGAIAVVDPAQTSSDADLSKPAGGKVVFDVWSPSVVAEATDVAILCHEPAGATGSSSPIVHLVAMHAAAQWMTTPRYRALARGIDLAIAEAPTEDARRKVALTSADQIGAQIRGRAVDRCAYATILRAVAAAK